MTITVARSDGDDVAPLDRPTGRSPSRFRRLWRGKPEDPPWSRPALLLVAILAGGLFTWGLSRNGYGNEYYGAAVLSATKSWKAFLFGSLDPGSFITVDKPPLALWLMALSARAFGFSSWSILLPEALAGVASVLVLHRLVRRWAGAVAALLASLAFALTPVAVAMFRIDQPDAVLTLLLLLGAWGVWSAIETGRTQPLVWAGTAIGAAFLAKMLQAFIVLPALGLVYLLCGPPRLGRRVLQLLAFTAAVVVSAGWWVALVELWPAGSRPYVGGSTDNSVLDLVFGYNGLARVTGGSGTPGGGGGRSFGGVAGWLRMFDAQVGGQVAWLLPLAAAGLVAGLWLTAHRPRTDRLRAGFVLWGLWALVHVVVFSTQRGIFHPYYTVALAPAVAALAGAGAVCLWRLGGRSAWHAWLLPVAVVGTGALSASLLARTPTFVPWLRTAVPALAVAGGLALGLVRHAPSRRRLAALAAAIAAVAVLAGPAAYALDTTASTQRGSMVAGGPPVAGNAGGPGRSFGLRGPGGQLPGGLQPPAGSRPPGAVGAVPQAGGASDGGRTVDAGLVSYLRSNQGSATYLVAVEGSQQAAPLIIATGQPVIAMGGFSGGDPAPTAAQLATLVSQGKVRYVLLGGGRGGPAGRSATSSERDLWVTQHCTVVPSTAYGSSSSSGATLYACGAGGSG